MKIFSKKSIVVIVMIGVGLFLSAGLVAVIGSDQANTTDNKIDNASPVDKPIEQNFGKLIFRTVLSLFVVVGLLFLGMFGFKWINSKISGRPNLTGQIRLHGSIPLGPKRALYFAQVLNRVLVLGVTDTSVSLLTEITGDEEVKAFLNPSDKGSSFQNKSFATHLEHFTQKLKM